MGTPSRALVRMAITGIYLVRGIPLDIQRAARARAEPESHEDGGMKWVVDFYHQRRALVARYDVDAPSAAAAVVLGRQALLAQHPPAPPRGRPSLFERAERIGGQDGTGWIVYRIAKGDGMPADAVSS